MWRWILVSVLGIIIQDAELFTSSRPIPKDPGSFSEPEIAKVSNIFLDITVDFEDQIMRGHVDLIAEKISPDAEQIILDTKYLKIDKVLNNITQKPLEYELTFDKIFGTKLSIQLPKTSSNSSVLRIYYETSPNATGLKWLAPKFTAGKIHPYVFSLFQTIEARSVLPCQDTPSVKAEYSATIRTSKNLTAVMSAILTSSEIVEDEKIFRFHQEIPIPSYLIAIAVGALDKRRIGPRSHVWTEKENMEASVYELADTEKYMKIAEDICGPYIWGIYDIVVLPSSFAYGGMENPSLTFLSTSILNGDRFVAMVIVAHEIIHSWSGNLVTNANYGHYWLNEGMTTFIERKVKRRLTSPQEQDFSALGAVISLNETITELLKEGEGEFTKLVMNLTGVHPEDAFTDTAYEKGYIFLRYLENTVGGPDEFEPFLRHYLETFKFKSIVTDDFKELFENHFASKPAIKSIDWNTWLFSPGMPPIIPEYDQTLARICREICTEFLAWDGESEFPISKQITANLTLAQKMYLLQLMIDAQPQSITKLQALDKICDFSKNRNSEIKYGWIRIGLKYRWEDAIQKALQFINEIGRHDILVPLYKELYAWDKSRDKAVKNYKANKESMMLAVISELDEVLHINS